MTAETGGKLPGPPSLFLARAFSSQKRRLLSAWLLTGPAVVVSVAYIDPGNFATNIQAGAKYGYALLWVVLASNLVAMLFQALSAKLGIVTGRNLAELSRDEFPRAVSFSMWIVSEIAAMATDLAEFTGAAIGVSLLSGLPLLWSMAAVAVFTYAVLVYGGGGYRRLELVVGGFVVLIGACYLAELFIVPIDWNAAALGLVKPQIPDREALTISVGIIGATVMPHAIYLHSALTQNRAPVRSDIERARVLRYSNREVVAALSVAGLANLAMVAMAAGAFYAGHPDVAEIETAYHTLTPLFGGAAAGVFLVSLIASGLSSSVVGTLGGQVILQGFLRRSIPLWFRRAVTMAPAFAVAATGVSATSALVGSQVVLSLALPVPMIALLLFTGNRGLMGAFANGRLVNAAAWTGAALVLALNLVLLYETLVA